MARPSKYNEETPKKAREYLDTFDKDGDVVPTIEGLAEHLGVRRSTVYDWNTHPEKGAFSDIFDAILKKQSRILINNGLTGDFSAPITKMMLTKHGYTETTNVNQQISGKPGGEPIQWIIQPVEPLHEESPED
jgi:hypothetical protein